MVSLASAAEIAGLAGVCSTTQGAETGGSGGAGPGSAGGGSGGGGADSGGSGTTVATAVGSRAVEVTRYAVLGAAAGAALAVLL